jgi:hypothetical protein
MRLPHPRHARFGLDGGSREFGKTLKKADDLGHRHEAVWIIAGIAVARQTALPVRCQKAKRVPPLCPP